MSSAICFNLDRSKILSSGNGSTLFSINVIPSFNDREGFGKLCGNGLKR